MPENLARRLVVAAIAIPLVAYLIFAGGWILSATISLLAAIGAAEFYGLADARGNSALKYQGVATAALFPLVVYAIVSGALDPVWLAVLAPVWVMAVSLSVLATRGPEDNPLAAVSVTMWGCVYAGLLPSAIVILRHGPAVPSDLAALFVVFLPLILTCICDTVAMAGGSLIGGKKLAPVVSPNKTWAGAASGALVAVVLAPIYGEFVLIPLGVELPFWLLVSIGLVVGILGQLGDLVESLFKREAGLKDSGGVFPGHGGVLDRLDSLYWVLPSTAVVFKMFGIL